MTVKDFSDQFDALLGTGGTPSIALDEYEKSVFLSMAQEMYIKRILGDTAEGPDSDSSRQVALSSLVTVADMEPCTDSGRIPYSDHGFLFEVPSDILMVLNESARTSSGKRLVVVPIHYMQYDRIQSRVFSHPLVKQCWRLFQWKGGVDAVSELVPFGGIVLKGYRMRYVRKPSPIILVDLALENQRSLEIDGVTAVTECALPSAVHRDILLAAVELARASRGATPTARKEDKDDAG